MKRKTVVTICIVLAIMMGMAIAIPAIWGGFLATQVSAKTASELQQELDQSRKERQELKGQLDETTQEKESVLSKKKVLDEEISGLSADINTVNEEIAQKEAAIEQKEEEIAKLEQEIDSTDDLLKKRLRVMYEKGSAGYLEVIFSASSFSDLLVRLDMVQQLLSHDQQLIGQLTERKQGVESARQEIVTEQKEKEAMRSILSSQKAELESKTKQANALLGELESKEEELEDLLKEREAFENQILAEQKRIIAEQQAAQNNANSSSNSGQTVNYSGGQLHWPCAIRGTITSGYGYRPNMWPHNHNGIDIGVPYGTGILAAESGIVTTAGWDNSYGYYIIINHGSISTLYGHNSTLLVSKGQQVSRGQKIALAGSTGNSSGPHCHFSVIAGGGYVDPRPYIF